MASQILKVLVYKIWHVTGILLHEYKSPSDQIHIHEVTWQTLPADLYKGLPIRKPLGPGIQPSDPPTTSKKAYRPPHARGQPEGVKDPLHVLEPPQNAPSQSTDQKMSKSAQKNKKKREAKGKAKQDGRSMDNRSEEQRAALAMASVILAEPAPAPAVGVDVEAEKKIKNLRKKLKAIEKLKEQLAGGKELERNQLDKLTMEEEVRMELARLGIQ